MAKTKLADICLAPAGSRTPCRPDSSLVTCLTEQDKACAKTEVHIKENTAVTWLLASLTRTWCARTHVSLSQTQRNIPIPALCKAMRLTRTLRASAGSRTPFIYSANYLCLPCKTSNDSAGKKILASGKSKYPYNINRSLSSYRIWVFPKLPPMVEPLKLSVYPGEPLPIKTLTGDCTRRLLQYCQLPDKNSRDISTDIWIFRGILKYLRINSTISRQVPIDVL